MCVSCEGLFYPTRNHPSSNAVFFSSSGLPIPTGILEILDEDCTTAACIGGGTGFCGGVGTRFEGENLEQQLRGICESLLFKTQYNFSLYIEMNKRIHGKVN